MNDRKRASWRWITLLIVVLAGGVILWMSSTGGANSVTLQDIHGLGFTSDGQRIMVASHDGLKIFENGEWDKSEGPEADYMGFTVTDKAIFSSGHPPQGSNMKNPLGLVKSDDEGKTLQTLVLDGEADFHSLAASYNTHTLYALNTELNSLMDSQGLFYSRDEGKTWKKSGLSGIKDETIYSHMALSTLAVHPTEENKVAIGLASGLYFSSDYGDTFEQLFSDIQVTSLHFGKDGALYVGAFGQEAELFRLDTKSGEKENLQLPELTKDTVIYFVQNPINDNDLVFATYKLNVFRSQDRGATWSQIVKEGKTIDSNQ